MLVVDSEIPGVIVLRLAPARLLMDLDDVNMTVDLSTPAPGHVRFLVVVFYVGRRWDAATPLTTTLEAERPRRQSVTHPGARYVPAYFAGR